MFFIHLHVLVCFLGVNMGENVSRLGIPFWMRCKCINKKFPKFRWHSAFMVMCTWIRPLIFISQHFSLAIYCTWTIPHSLWSTYYFPLVSVDMEENCLTFRHDVIQRRDIPLWRKWKMSFQGEAFYLGEMRWDSAEVHIEAVIPP